MPFNGSGTYSRLYSWVIDAANNVNISSSRTDAEMNGFAAGLTNCITRDGQSPPSADLPMGGKKLVNLGAATVGTDALSQAAGDARYLQSGSALPHTITFNNAGSGAASGAVFDVTANLTISYNTHRRGSACFPDLHWNSSRPNGCTGNEHYPTGDYRVRCCLIRNYSLARKLCHYCFACELCATRLPGTDRNSYCSHGCDGNSDNSACDNGLRRCVEGRSFKRQGGELSACPYRSRAGHRL
jgi:hypothetical protein